MKRILALIVAAITSLLGRLQSPGEVDYDGSEDLREFDMERRDHAAGD